MSSKRQKWHKAILFGVVVLLGLMLQACDAPTQDVEGFTLQQTYTLSSGEQRTGDQLILANEITLAAKSTIDGDVALIGDMVTLGGIVIGDVIVVADHLTVENQAQITGDLIVCSDDFQQNADAIIEGEVTEECTDSNPVSIVNFFESGWNNWQQRPILRLGSMLMSALFFGAVAALSVVLLPRHSIRISESALQFPRKAGGLGCLTLLVTGGLTTLYAISLLLVLPIILLPVVMFGWLVIGLLSLLGWAALAGPFGVYLLRRLGMDQQPRMVAAMMGGFALALLLMLWNVFWFTTWIGFLATIILGSIGLGAVFLTRGGTKPYPRHEVRSIMPETGADD